MPERYLLLSNYGIRFLQNEARSRSADELANDPVLGTMTAIWSRKAVPFDAGTLQVQLLDAGLATSFVGPIDAQAIQLRYRRNPLENVRSVVFEITRRCNFRCMHCRNAGVRETPAQRSEAQVGAVQEMAALGIRRFDFVGGEVTRFGDGWLDIVDRVACVPGAIAGVVTNGWFLERENFEAAGETFPNDEVYLAHLRERGVTHAIFSLDGPAALHDEWRRSPGLHARIVRGFDRVRAAGLVPRVSLIVRKGEPTAWLLPIARRLYAHAATDEEAYRLLRQDDTNYASNFIDVGGGAELQQGGVRPDEVPEELLRCKNYFRPCPSIRIQASGELSLCPLLDAGEGYGNVNERGLVSVVNELQEAFVYRLHAERHIGAYRHLLTPDWFGERAVHVCSMRAALTLIARELHQHGIAADDVEGARPIVKRVARRTRSVK